MDTIINLYFYAFLKDVIKEGTFFQIIFLEFFLGILSVWYLTHLLQNGDAKRDLTKQIRKRFPSEYLKSLMSCFYCLSLWISIPVAVVVGSTFKDQVLLWPALSAGAIVIESAKTRLQEHLSPDNLKEDKEKSDESNK